MVSRREFMVASAALAGLVGTSLSGTWSRAAARQSLTENDLLGAKPLGNVTLLHITDLHAQLMPVYFREPSVNLGVGEVAGLPPHVTGADFLGKYGITAGSPQAYALTSEDFASLGRTYGRMGGVDRIAAIVKRVRGERPDATLFLDGGDTWQGSYTAQATQADDMIEVTNALGIDAMTAHWEFTYGTERVKELVEKLNFPFLCGNVFDAEWDEPAFESTAFFDRGGARIAVIGQAFPYTPIANPRWMIPDWSFGIREEQMQANVDAARADGADVVVVLSHNGFDVDRKMASRITGIDVLLTGHTHDALPDVVKVNETLLVASGSNGKFVSRVDLDVADGKVKDFRYTLIPVFSDVITPDADMAGLVERIRAPHAAELSRELARADTLLYRRGNFNGTFDDLICDALLAERDAEIALSPGFRWGTSILPGQPITVEDIHNATAMTYPAAYRNTMTGETLKAVLEDVADNLFNPDPYYQQGGDMVRVGGVKYAINPWEAMGSRISDMTLANGEAIDPAREYVVAGWASVNEGTEGPPIWDVVESHLRNTPVVGPMGDTTVRIKGNG